MAQFLTLPSGMLINLDQVAVVQLIKHEDGSHVRHARMWMVGTPHKESFELGREDIEFLLEHARKKDIISEAEIARF